jgi:hypothetical protein
MHFYLTLCEAGLALLGIIDSITSRRLLALGKARFDAYADPA